MQKNGIYVIQYLAHPQSETNRRHGMRMQDQLAIPYSPKSTRRTRILFQQEFSLFGVYYAVSPATRFCTYSHADHGIVMQS